MKRFNHDRGYVEYDDNVYTFYDDEVKGPIGVGLRYHDSKDVQLFSCCSHLGNVLCLNLPKMVEEVQIAYFG